MTGGSASFAHRILSGQARGVGPAVLRGLLGAVEPIYAGAMWLRNRLYDCGLLGATRLNAPVISIGNITAGGTGKTPMVAWLARSLRQHGRRPAILLRGYKAQAGQRGDEQRMLAAMLGDEPPVPVHADPDRVRGGAAVLGDHPAVDTLILDDGFQHRRLHRDFDLVLIDATEPFGYDHVHPRGLLREGLSGLRRARAFVLTRADLVSDERLADIEATIRRHNASSPIARARHVHRGFRSDRAPASASPNLDMHALRGKRFVAMAGIANPTSLHRQLVSLDGAYAGSWWFADHHPYTAADVDRIQRAARDCSAEVILTTEKDWVKLADLPGTTDAAIPFWRLDLAIEIEPSAEVSLLGDILGICQSPRS